MKTKKHLLGIILLMGTSMNMSAQTYNAVQDDFTEPVKGDYRLLVGKAELVLHQHRTDPHPGRFVACTFLLVVKA